MTHSSQSGDGQMPFHPGMMGHPAAFNMPMPGMGPAGPFPSGSGSGPVSYPHPGANMPLPQGLGGVPFAMQYNNHM